MMGKIGQFVTIPIGSYCNATLDSGEKIVVNHEPDESGASADARLMIGRLKMVGFTPETMVRMDLDTAAGKAALAALAKGASGTPGSPLRAFVAYVQQCASIAEVVAHCPALLHSR